MKVAIIPARGGSKRIPRKNIRLFCGKPMLAWTLEVAHSSGCFDQILVSTDDDEIAELARNHGAWAPFKRPAHLSNDHATTGQVVHHAYEWLKGQGFQPERYCTLYATAPFLQATDITACEALLDQPETDIAFAATSFPFPIQRALRILGNGSVEMFEPQHAQTRSQDLEKAYHDAGMMYWCSSRAMEESIPTFSQHARVYLLPRERVQDIDDEEDWQNAEAMFHALRVKKINPST